MALILPPPITPREIAADVLIRAIELTAPIIRGAPVGPWLIQLMTRREDPAVGVDVALCAAGRILRALPETNVSAQWALLALIAETPIGAFGGTARFRLDFVRLAMLNLHQFATAPTGYTLAQLRAKARELGDVFVNPSPQEPVLTLDQMRAYRAGYHFWFAILS